MESGSRAFPVPFLSSFSSVGWRILFLDCLDFLHSTAARTPSCFSTSRDLLHFFLYSDIRGAMSLLPSDWSKRARDLLESKLRLTICIRFSLAIYLIFNSNLRNSVTVEMLLSLFICNYSLRASTRQRRTTIMTAIVKQTSGSNAYRIYMIPIV